MKTTIRIATDPYSYIESEVDGTEEEIAQVYMALKEAMDNVMLKPDIPVATPFPSEGDEPLCTKCNAPMRQIPAGVSKSTGKPYNAFMACPNRCK